MCTRFSLITTEPPSEWTSRSKCCTGTRAPSSASSCGTSPERYGNMTRVYYREAVGALVVFDMTRASTFQAVLKWKGDLDAKVALGNGHPVPAVLLANKCDQQRLCAKLPKLESFSKEQGFVGWYETSAKDNTNIDKAVMRLVEHIMASDVEKPADDSDPSRVILPTSDYNLHEHRQSTCSVCSRLHTPPKEHEQF
ncbi:ras-related protein Rab-32 isoform X2 [Pangasianodon hypophthalmus]|uniref:ras-related protein Rab-32 isoform X2 n=1 Tax=Pangasianodon hypophthalmus TaxID=310915 RepID=UPI00230775CD|nr:ras-related protein Rab-32 isoform X2 [Pangasianodon hypophthalmus]